MTLTRLRDYVTAFTDRPARSSTDVPNSDFFDKYSNRFADDPPNAVLSYNVANSIQPTNIVLTISNPSYDPKRKTVKYDAVRVQTTDNRGNPDTPFTAPITHASLTPKAFGRVALFIDDATTTYSVGDTGPAGGIVFYMTPDTYGLHGLEAAPVDQAYDGPWCNLSSFAYGTNQIIGSGLTNTNLIIEICGSNSAAGTAASYSLNGHTDWYLPSLDELSTLITNVNSGAVVLDMTGLYWSSTACYGPPNCEGNAFGAESAITQFNIIMNLYDQPNQNIVNELQETLRIIPIRAF